MIIKGKNQHVMPSGSGWCVIDEGNQKLTQHFPTRESAIAHARAHANAGEADVLIHTAYSEFSGTSTVRLPQRETLKTQCHLYAKDGLPTPESQDRGMSSGNRHSAEAFDPLLGMDASHFDI